MVRSNPRSSPIFFAKEQSLAKQFAYYPDDIRAPVQEFKIYALEQASLYLMACEALAQRGPQKP